MFPQATPVRQTYTPDHEGAAAARSGRPAAASRQTSDPGSAESGSRHGRRTRPCLFLLILLTPLLQGCGGDSVAAEPRYPGIEGQPLPTFTPLPPPTATITPLPSATPTEPYRTATPDIFQAAGRPVLLEIPAIQVRSTIEEVGVLPNGQMDVPRVAMNVAWFRDSALPGQKGKPAVIAGHLDSPTGPAVFYKMRFLIPGDEMVVTYENGDRYVFVVEGKERYLFDQAPLAKIFGRNPGRMLNLITCDGAWDSGSANYQQRLVVYARLKDTQ